MLVTIATFGGRNFGYTLTKFIKLKLIPFGISAMPPPPPRKKSKSNDVVSEVGSDSDSIKRKNTIFK